MVITTTQSHSIKSEIRLCTGSNPACGVLEISDLWQWFQLEMRLNAFCQWTIMQKQFITIVRSSKYCIESVKIYSLEFQQNNVEHCHVTGIQTHFCESYENYWSACKYVSKYNGNLCDSPRMLNLLKISLALTTVSVLAMWQKKK